MRKVFVFLLGILIISVIGHFSLSKAYAQITVEQDPKPVCQDSKNYTLTFTGPENTFQIKEDYSFAFWEPNTDINNFEKSRDVSWKKPTDTQTFKVKGFIAPIGRWHYKLWLGKGYGIVKEEPNRLLASGDYVVFPKEACDLGLPILEMSSPVQINATVPIKVKNINPDSDYILWFIDGQVFNNGKFPANFIINETIKDKAGNEKNIKTASFSVILDNKPGTKTLCLKHGSTNFFGFGKDNCEISIPIEVIVQPPQVTPIIIQSNEPGASLEESSIFSEPTTIPPLSPCSQWANLQETPIPIQQAEDRKDIKCIAVATAIGDISTNPQGFVRSIFGIVLGIAGGIALILIMLSGYKMMASQGNPEALTASREQLASAIIGLLFIIFSFVILQVIGVDILKIPGFNP